MAQLIVRQLEDALVRALRARAALHGRSAEEEHRRILREVLVDRPAKRSLKDLLLGMPAVGEDEDFARNQDHGRTVNL